MKKQQTPHKLEIRRETLMPLERQSLEPVQGGGRGAIEITSDLCPQ